MQFHSARCEVCNAYVFHENLLLAYRIVSDGAIEPAELAGRQPWSGIRCVCRLCAVILADMIVEGGAR